MKPMYIYILLSQLVVCGWTQRSQGQGTGYDGEYNKLIRFLSKTIYEDELRDKVFNRASSFIMLGFHLDERKKIDSISIQSSDFIISKSMKSIKYNKLEVNWEELVPKNDPNFKTCNKLVTFYWPVFIINRSEKLGRMLFSREDIERALFKDNLEKAGSYSLQCSILIKSVELEVYTHEAIE